MAAYLDRDVTTVQAGRSGKEWRPTGMCTTSAAPWMQRRARRLDSEPPPELPISDSEKVGPRTHLSFLFFVWALAAALCVCLVAAAWLVFRHRARLTVKPRVRSLAVLPLRNLSGDPAQDYLADGITDVLIGRL